ncbi:hypothetical protein [Gudongella oleilytica]|jgi:hypothetical protein|uniref:hypothetical protein n=1 Tax=Gudongella oleilytica TaxID=1582259 RepID=UPI000FF8A882|nr:hypothetical protein [Gudongella oleilytica]MDY0255761.1 hypothetical protein [Gudongella oleilytica]
MLVFKDIRDEDQLGKYLLENGLEPKALRDSTFFGGFEDEKLFGICEAYLSDDGVFLGNWHVDGSHSGQGMEEAILRSLFNKLELNQIDYIYSKDKHNLLDRIGFRDSPEGYRLDLKKLFDGGCSCCGGEVHEE